MEPAGQNFCHAALSVGSSSQGLKSKQCPATQLAHVTWENVANIRFLEVQKANPDDPIPTANLVLRKVNTIPGFPNADGLALSGQWANTPRN